MFIFTAKNYQTMKKTFLLAALTATIALVVTSVNAQVIVNPDGTHSVVHGNVVVNPDGTHSPIHGNVIVNPNGTHSVVQGNVIENSDGTHSTIPNNIIENFGEPNSTHDGAADNSNGIHPDIRGGDMASGAMSVSYRHGFFVGDRHISVAQAKYYSSQYPEAIRHMRMGQFVYGVSFAAAFGGGYIIGWQIGNAAGGIKMNAGALTAGAAIIGGAVGLTYVTVGQYKKAAAAYNAATGMAGLPRHDITIALAPAVGGLGLRLTF